jgi:hypothetical protein
LQSIVVDACPLIAMFSRSDRYHASEIIAPQRSNNVHLYRSWRATVRFRTIIRSGIRNGRISRSSGR